MGNAARKVALVASATKIAPVKLRRVRGHRTGLVVGRSEGDWLVDYPNNPHGPLPARTTVALRDAIPGAGEQSVLLVFEDERSDRPIIVGCFAQEGPATECAVERPQEARVDGQRVVIEAQDEIVLRCGEASITLRRNGRVVVRGAYVETRSRGVNRIKGGSVQIN
jgi:hypothetical protein